MFSPSSPRAPSSVRPSHKPVHDDSDSANRIPQTEVPWASSMPSVDIDTIEEGKKTPLNDIEQFQQKSWMEQYLRQRLGAELEIKITDNRHRMLSVKRSGDRFVFRCHHMFLHAPESIVDAMARYAQLCDPEAVNLLQNYVDQHDRWIRASISTPEKKLRTKGQFHNLKQVLRRLNLQYFSGKVDVRICWGPRPQRKKQNRSSIQLGSYVVEDRLIRIHWVLDAPDIPRFFLDWIVFHEMLHHIYPMPIVDGRRILHSREFRRAEMQFEHYAEAVLWERTHLRRLLQA